MLNNDEDEAAQDEYYNGNNLRKINSCIGEQTYQL